MTRLTQAENFAYVATEYRLPEKMQTELLVIFSSLPHPVLSLPGYLTSALYHYISFSCILFLSHSLSRSCVLLSLCALALSLSSLAFSLSLSL